MNHSNSPVTTVDFPLLQGSIDASEYVDHAPKHHFLEDPKDWLSEYKEVWESQFPERPTAEINIGCSDPRLNDACDLRLPGLRGFDISNLEKAAKKIIALQRRVLRNSRIVLRTHDDCGAMKKSLRDRGADEKHCDRLSKLWGNNLVQRIMQQKPDSDISHEHLHIDKMMPQPKKMEVLYVDCTDRFHASKALPSGPTVSLMNPKGIVFSTGIALRHILGNGLDNHLMPEVRFMVEHLSGGESSSKRFSEKNPLTIVLVRDRRQFAVSNIAQRTVEDFAKKHYGRIKVLPIDQRGTIYEPLSADTPIGLP